MSLLKQYHLVTVGARVRRFADWEEAFKAACLELVLLCPNFKCELTEQAPNGRALEFTLTARDFVVTVRSYRESK